MPRLFRWNNSDEAVYQLMKMNEFLSDIFGAMEDIRQSVTDTNNTLDRELFKVRESLEGISAQLERE